MALIFSPLVSAHADEPAKVQNRVIPEFSSATPGQTLTLAIEQKMEDHWHVYWKNPGDSGESTRIRWILPDGVTAGETAWPLPERIAFGPLMNFGFNKKAIYLVDVNVPANYTAPTLPVTADIELLVCKDICIPETAQVKLDIPVAPSGAVPTDEAYFKQARANIPQTVAWQGMVEEADNALMLSFRPDAEIVPELQSAKSISFFPDEWGLIQNPAPQKTSVENGQLTFNIPRDTRSLSEVKEIKGTIVVEKSDGTRTGFNVQTPIAALPQSAVPAALATDDDTAPDVAPDTAAESDMSTMPGADTPLFQALLFAFFGGLILNLMPCVFPILSIKALSLVKMSDKEQRHAAMSGVAYTLGVLTCFAAIAGALIALQHAGQNIGWGFQLQNPIIVLLLSYVLFVVGLNLSGMFEFSGNLANVGQNLTRKNGYAGSFFTGALATIVATPCTAPFMGIALGYALLQPPIVALVIFLALGFGLALPYLLLTLFPPFRKILPRPGAWMETFRQFLAFPMFASAAWLVWVYGQQVDGYYAGLLALLGGVAIALGIWVWKRAPHHQPARSFVRGVAILFFISSISVATLSMAKMPVAIDGMSASNDTHALPEMAAPFTPAAFETAISGKDPVFVEMTASWCITCKVNEKVALTTSETQKLFKDNNVVYLQGDWTNQNPQITDFLKSHGRNGVPLYVFYGERDPTTNQRPDPVVLPQLLTNGLVADIVTNQ